MSRERAPPRETLTACQGFPVDRNGGERRSMTVQMMEAPVAEAPRVALIRRAHEGDIEVPLVEVDGKLALPFFLDLKEAGRFMETVEEYGPAHGWGAVMVDADSLELVASFKGVEWAMLISEADYMSGTLGTVHRWAEIINDPEA
jgi:hypothetical protein